MLEDRFSVLKTPTYWSAPCLENWRHPDDLVFTLAMPPANALSVSRRTLEYEWSEPVTVAELFILMSEQSSQESLPILVTMADSKQKCLVSNLKTGYHSCETAVTGRKLQITVASQHARALSVSIAALNIYPTRNMVTTLTSGLTVTSEKPRSTISNFFSGSFDRGAVPRDPANEDKCVLYLRDSRREFPELVLDLGKQMRLDAIQVVSKVEALAACSATFSNYLNGL